MEVRWLISRGAGRRRREEQEHLISVRNSMARASSHLPSCSARQERRSRQEQVEFLQARLRLLQCKAQLLKLVPALQAALLLSGLPSSACGLSFRRSRRGEASRVTSMTPLCIRLDPTSPIALLRRRPPSSACGLDSLGGGLHESKECK